MGTRKIQTSEIGNSTKSQAAVTHNSGAFSGLNSNLSDFIGEAALQGKGWASAKALAEVYKTITQTFSMVSEQLANANQKVVSSQGILLNSQIDEQALKTQIMQNKANMTQLSYANSIWNSANPGKTNQNSYNNLQQSIKNENGELEKELESLNEFDMATKYAYDDLEHTLSNLARLISQVSNASNTYNSKTGLFSTKGIDMKVVKDLDKKYQQNIYKMPKSMIAEIENIKHSKLSATEKADKIASVYEKYLYSLDSVAFDKYWGIRSQYEDWGKAPKNVREAAENELSQSLRKIPINIKILVQKLGEDIIQFSQEKFGFKQYKDFIDMVNTDQPLDLKSRLFSNTNYSIWSRGWEGVPSGDYLGNYLYGYYAQGVLTLNGKGIKYGAGLAQQISDFLKGKLISNDWNKYGDNKGDSEMIQDGIDDYNKKHKN